MDDVMPTTPPMSGSALRQSTLIVSAFFLIVVTLVPFGVGPDPELLSKIAPGILWLGSLLA